MSDNNNFNDRVGRRRRVTRIRNTLLIIIALWFVTSIAATTFLLIQVASLKRQVMELKQTTEQSDDSGKSKAGKKKKDKSEKTDKSAIATASDEQSESVEKANMSPENVKRSESYEDNAEEMEKLESEARSEGKPKIYLTFNGAPSDQTAEILDILSSNEIKGTFFCDGETGKDSEAIYKRIADEGHTLGMSSYSRDFDKVYSSPDNFKEDFTKIREYVLEVTGIEPSFYRFAKGSNSESAGASMQELCEYVRNEGVEYVDWNCEAGDSSGEEISAAEMVENVTSNVLDYESSIILLNESNEQTKEALPDIIEAIKAADSSAAFFPLTEGTDRCHHLKLPGEE